jgi:hypothetical protein
MVLRISPSISAVSTFIFENMPGEWVEESEGGKFKTEPKPSNMKLQFWIIFSKKYSNQNCHAKPEVVGKLPVEPSK